MSNIHDEINDLIKNRQLHPGNDENTYYSPELYDFAVDNHDDPFVLFKIKVYGYYQKRYKWTREQADWFIENNIAEAYSHSDGSQEYLYDWGKGKNKVTGNMMHEPNLDHINPASLSNNDHPSNFRIRCARLNENKGNMSTDQERRATVIDTLKDMSESSRNELLSYLDNLYDRR
jgi:hypothetical protein